MRVLAGGPAREVGSAVFGAHRAALEAQAGVVEHEVVPDPGGARWTVEKIERVARARQRMMDRAASEFDALWMVDTDVLVGPGVLEEMLAVDAPVVYGVFWSVWPGFEQPLPQVWDEHPYGFGGTRTVERLMEGESVEVVGGGACTLIRDFSSRYWPLLRGMPSGSMWAGEDRTFAIGCDWHGLRQVAVGGLRIVHLYTPELQAELDEARRLVGW